MAEDLVQETFLAALPGRERFQGASSERTWLAGILKHKILDHLRRKHREQPVSSLGEDEWVNDLFDQKGHWKKAPGKWSEPGAFLEIAEFWSAFGLPRQTARTLGRGFASRGGRPRSAEACELLAISASNLGVMLHRARLRLWRCLGTNSFAHEGKRP